MKQQKFIQIQNEIPMTHFFVYKDKQYPFQIDFFKYSSNFFLNNQQSLEQNKIIPLVDKEYEESLNFSEESIFSFIKYVQREQIPLNDDNVFALNYLGTRYQINSLIESTKEYIEQNKTGLILQILTNFQFDQKFNKQQYEDILSTNLINYISDDRLLSLEYPIIYRAIEKTPNKSNSKIIDFCFKCLDKFGRKASSLFALIDICDVSNEKLNLLITKYSKIFDFHFINSTFLKSLYESQNDFYLNEKKNDAEHEKILLLLNELKENQSIIMDEKKQLEDQIINQIKEDMNQLKIDHQNEINQIKEDMNQLKIDHQNEINQIKEDMNQLKIDHQNEINQIKSEFDHIKLKLEQKSKEIKSFEKIKNDVNKLKDEIQNLRSIQSQFKYYLWLLNTTDIEKFNNMDGEMQLFILIINQALLKNQTIFSKIIEFHLYLTNEVMKSKNKRKDKFNYIFIHYDKTETDTDIDFSSIGISWQILEILYENKSLNSSEFQNQISNFTSFYFEIGYPSHDFDFILYDVLRKKKLDKSKIKISIFIHKLNETDFKLSESWYIDYVRLDSTINTIKGAKDIGSFKECSIKEISIPSSVTSIGDNAFYHCGSLAKITIPSSVTSIGDHAFYYCGSLTRISIPSSVTSIGNYAFSRCFSLTQISIHSSVTSIGDYAFSECSSLTQISIPSSITSFGGNVFYNSQKLEKIIIIPCKEKRIEYLDDKFIAFKTDPKNDIYDILIWANKNLNMVNIPLSIKRIGDGVFRNFSSLTKISIPSNVISIGHFVCSCCESLTQISLPSSVTEIEKNAFRSCEKLEQISLPSSITSIKKGAFYGCESLTQLSIPSSVKEIGEEAFAYCYKLTKVSFEIPSSINLIDNEAFNNCSELTQISIPLSIKYIGNKAFSCCKELTQISIPSSINSFGYNVLNCCPKLNKVEILSNNEKRIEYFEDKFIVFKTDLKNDTYDTLLWTNPKISTTTIPSFIKIIGKCAFNGCSSLTQITIPSSVTSIGEGAFSFCESLTQITIPSSITSFGSNVFFRCWKINKIEIIQNNEKRVDCFENKFLVYKTNAENDVYDTLLWANHNITTATIPSSVTTIRSRIFDECSSLTQITIPSSVISIGDSAFSFCTSLKQISIPSSVISIGDNAFTHCTSLKQISIPFSVNSIGKNAFECCDSLTQITIPSSIIKNNLGIPINTNIIVI